MFDSDDELQGTSHCYLPDVWVFVKFSGSDVPKVYYRVLAGWYGGFAQGDSWRLSSGIESIEDAGDRYLVKNSSGSLYECLKSREKLSHTTSAVLSGYGYKRPEQFSVDRVSFDDVKADGSAEIC